MVPGAAEVGDSIVVVAGSKVPFVMRKVEGGDKEAKWSLIQECYVHSVMSGAFAQDGNLSSWKDLLIM